MKSRRRGLALHLFLAPLALASAACGLVIGLGDAKPEEPFDAGGVPPISNDPRDASDAAEASLFEASIPRSDAASPIGSGDAHLPDERSFAAGSRGLFAIGPNDGNVYQFGGAPNVWARLGPARAPLAVNDDGVYALPSVGDGVVHWSDSTRRWVSISSQPFAGLVAYGHHLFAVSASSGDIYAYASSPEAGAPSWKDVGGPGKAFVANAVRLYGLASDSSKISQMDYDTQIWISASELGGGAIYAGGSFLFVTDTRSGALYRFDGAAWTLASSAALDFAVAYSGRLYSIGLGGTEVDEVALDGGAPSALGPAASRLYVAGEQLYAFRASSSDVWRYEGTPGTWTKLGFIEAAP